MLKHFLAKMDNNTQGPLHHFPQKFKTKSLHQPLNPLFLTWLSQYTRVKKAKRTVKSPFRFGAQIIVSILFGDDEHETTIDR